MTWKLRCCHVSLWVMRGWSTPSAGQLTSTTSSTWTTANTSEKWTLPGGFIDQWDSSQKIQRPSVKWNQLFCSRFDFYFRTGCSAYIEARPKMFVVQHGASIRYRRFVSNICLFFSCRGWGAIIQMPIVPNWDLYLGKFPEKYGIIWDFDWMLSSRWSKFLPILGMKRELSSALAKQDGFWSHVTSQHMQHWTPIPIWLDWSTTMQTFRNVECCNISF